MPQDVKKQQRKDQDEIRELLNCLKVFRRDYVNRQNDFSEPVRARIEAAIPRTYRDLQERGVEDPICMIN